MRRLIERSYYFLKEKQLIPTGRIRQIYSKLYHGTAKQIEETVDAYFIAMLKKGILLFFLVLLISGLVWIGEQIETRQEIHLIRSDYGEEEDTYCFIYQDEEQETQEISIILDPVEYRSEELEEQFRQGFAYLEQEMLGENQARDQIQMNLNLQKTIPDSGLSVSWSSDDYELLEENGTVKNEELTKPQQVRLLLELSYGERVESREYALTIQPKILTDEEEQKLTDPREDYNAVQNSDILTAIIPEQSGAISREQRNLQNMPSAAMEQQDDNWDFFSADFTCLDFTNLNFADLNFDSLNSFDLDTTDTGKLYEVAYILDNFQYYGHALNSEEDEDYHAMECEIEYILAGKASDYENLSKIAEELMVIRFVPNASYAFTNETMKKEALLAATLLLAPLHLEEAAKPVSYILLACWAYGESLVDVRGLLQGKCIPFTKDSSNWQLSLNGIKNLAQQEISDCDEEEGMTYQDYLIILCLMSNQQMQDYRMLDIMEWNLQKDIPGFKIENCICEFMLQTRIRENERVWYFEQTGSYLNRE